MQYSVVLEGVHGFVYTLLAFSFPTFFLGIFLASRQDGSQAGRRKKSNKITSNYLRLYKNPNQNTGNTRPIPYKMYIYMRTHTKILKRNAHILAGIFV